MAVALALAAAAPVGAAVAETAAAGGGVVVVDSSCITAFALAPRNKYTNMTHSTNSQSIQNPDPCGAVLGPARLALKQRSRIMLVWLATSDSSQGQN